jgi:phospholipase/carboxylesterase
MMELYLNRGYEVIGEISNCARIYSDQDKIITDSGKSIPIFPRGSYKKPMEWIAGYAPVDENTYVAVIKSVIPRLF